MAKVIVLGLGNILMGDDGVGPYVIRVLEAAYEIPEEVSVLDLGTPGLDLIPFMAGAEQIVLIDTVRAPGRPGEIRLYDRDEILKDLSRPRLSPHDPGVSEALSALELAGEGRKDLLLVGVIPERVATGVGLCPAVRAAVAIVAGIVAFELAGRGFPLRKRTPPGRPDIWWEADAPPDEGGTSTPKGRGEDATCTR